MISAFERTVAFRYLRSRRQEGFISVTAGFSLLGICLGVAALIIVMSVMNGFRHELINRILGFNGHITIIGPTDGIEGYDGLSTSLEGVPGAELVLPLVEGQALATSPWGQSGVVVRGVRPQDLERQTLVAENVKIGDLADFGAEPGVIVGTRLMHRLGLNYGDQINLISPQGVPTAFGTMPRSVSYPVVGVFEVGMFEFDSGIIYMPLDQAQTYFRRPETVTQIEIMVAEPENPEEARNGAFQIALESGVSGLRIADWQQTNRHLYGALQVERNVMFLILTLIILVAAFNIISSLIMLVKDKNGDIAIVRTMGASRTSVMKIFLLTGACIGIAGTLVGFVLGVLFCLYIEEIRQLIQLMLGAELFPAEIYFLSQLPAKLDWGEVTTIVGMALVLTFLAALYPAWRAARIEPAEALRYE
ncbi:MAG: lipoprotein-releasing system transmembrane subunit LolC [Rhodospirillaceae bacterium]|nr:lipoprotein-releasing system transmembrane subunit LolC [Rhodospirillaceae bacterium]